MGKNGAHNEIPKFEIHTGTSWAYPTNYIAAALRHEAEKGRIAESEIAKLPEAALGQNIEIKDCHEAIRTILKKVAQDFFRVIDVWGVAGNDEKIWEKEKQESIGLHFHLDLGKKNGFDQDTIQDIERLEPTGAHFHSNPQNPEEKTLLIQNMAYPLNIIQAVLQHEEEKGRLELHYVDLEKLRSLPIGQKMHITDPNGLPRLTLRKVSPDLYEFVGQYGVPGYNPKLTYTDDFETPHFPEHKRV